MPARTGEQFLRGLVDDREIWVGSDKISSPVDHPSLRGAALALPKCSISSTGKLARP